LQLRLIPPSDNHLAGKPSGLRTALNRSGRGPGCVIGLFIGAEGQNFSPATKIAVNLRKWADLGRQINELLKKVIEPA
jgi:hypothetical protein